MPTAQTIERALCRIAKANGYVLDENPRTGDKILVPEATPDDRVETYNITELARQLADELAP
jgi:hypothetical protein